MSFIRPEVRDWLGRWFGALLPGAVAALLALWAGQWAIRGSIVGMLGMLGFLWLAWSLLPDGVARGLLANPGGAAGRLILEEGRLHWLGPWGARSLDLDDLSRIEWTRSAGGQGGWILTAQGQAPLLVPAGAEGAAQLLDGFAALPGFDPAIWVASHRARGIVLIWQRPHR